MRKIFGLRDEEVKRGRNQLRNEKLHDGTSSLLASPKIGTYIAGEFKGFFSSPMGQNLLLGHAKLLLSSVHLFS